MYFFWRTPESRPICVPQLGNHWSTVLGIYAEALLFSLSITCRSHYVLVNYCICAAHSFLANLFVQVWETLMKYMVDVCNDFAWGWLDLRLIKSKIICDWPQLGLNSLTLTETRFNSNKQLMSELNGNRAGKNVSSYKEFKKHANVRWIWKVPLRTWWDACFE